MRNALTAAGLSWMKECVWRKVYLAVRPSTPLSPPWVLFHASVLSWDGPEQEAGLKKLLGRGVGVETLLKTPLRVCVCVCVCVHVYLRILGATSYSTFVPEGCVDSCSVVYKIIITSFLLLYSWPQRGFGQLWWSRTGVVCEERQRVRGRWIESVVCWSVCVCLVAGWNGSHFRWLVGVWRTCV